MRSIPSLLLNHKKGDATSLALLIKITPKQADVFGLTTLDKNITYDDGLGSLVYNSPVGFQPAALMFSAGVDVDNSEFQSLVPEYDVGISETDMNAGVYDYAEFVIYQVNYADLSQGHFVVMSGTLGQMRSKDGITSFGELRSIMDGFRKTITEMDSRTCRAPFGSQPGDQGVRFPCGFNAEVLWMNATVTSVGLESNRTFTASSLVQATGYFQPGLVQFLTGANAGRYIEVEQFTLGGILSLNFETPYPIEVGDTFRIREDCNKRARDASHGCKHFFAASWGLHFRGEPDIPIGDAASIQTPGATT